MSFQRSDVEAVLFTPTEAMCRAKSAFWVRFSQMPLADDKKINPTMAAQLIANDSIMKWWKQDGFKDWFLNKYEYAQRIEYLAALSLDVAEQILKDPKAPAQAKVNLIARLSELANKLPAKMKEIKYVDKQIGEMTPEQLEAYIAQNSKLLPETSDESKCDDPKSVGN